MRASPPQQNRLHMTQNTQKEKDMLDLLSPLIWVGDWAAYNNGKLHGAWIDASEGIDHVWDEINAILKSSPEPMAEEWGIFDHQGFHGYHVSENPNLEELCTVAELIWEHEAEEEGKGKVVAELIQDYGIDGAKEMLEDNFIGRFDDKQDFIYQHVEDCCLLEGVSETVKNYFDYEGFCRDMELNGDILFIEVGYGNVYVFYNR